MKILTLGVGIWVEKELKNNLKGYKKSIFWPKIGISSLKSP